MRLLLHAPQPSGASAVAMTLAQRPGCVAPLDLPYHHLAPDLPQDPTAAGRPGLGKALPRHCAARRPLPSALAADG